MIKTYYPKGWYYYGQNGGGSIAKPIPTTTGVSAAAVAEEEEFAIETAEAGEVEEPKERGRRLPVRDPDPVECKEYDVREDFGFVTISVPAAGAATLDGSAAPRRQPTPVVLLAVVVSAMGIARGAVSRRGRSELF